MRHLMLLAGLVALSASLGAATLGDMSFEKAMSTGHTRRAANLFDTATTTTPAAVDRFMNSALLEEGRESGDQMFGAGATLVVLGTSDHVKGARPLFRGPGQPPAAG